MWSVEFKVESEKWKVEITLDTSNADTVAALLEARQMMADPDTKKYSVEDALKELKA